MNKCNIQNKLDFSSLLLLAAFLKHGGYLYEQSVIQREAWPVSALL